jgi:hypothetical protein
MYKALYTSLATNPPTLKAIAEETSVPLRTLRRVRKEFCRRVPLRKGQPRAAAIRQFLHDHHQEKKHNYRKLTAEQTKTLGDMITTEGEKGTPMPEAQIRLEASNLCGSDTPMSKHWLKQFLSEHPQFSARIPSKLTASRALALNETTVEKYFDTIEKCILGFNLTAERIWNMDEKGFCGDSSATSKKVIADKSVRHLNHIKRNKFTDHFSLLAIVNAAGQAIPPVITFEGKTLSVDYTAEDWKDILLCVQKNGYFTRDTLPGIFNHISFHTTNIPKPLLLIYDGSQTHIDSEALIHAKSLGIEILCLPANTTHRLQPLDRSCFGPFSRKWKSACFNYRLHNNNQGIARKDIIPILKNAYNATITSNNIVSGFRSCGIWPFNRAAIDKKDFAPSINFSKTQISANNLNTTINININLSPPPNDLATSNQMLMAIKKSNSDLRKRVEELEKKKEKKPRTTLKTTQCTLLTQPEILQQIAELEKIRKEVEEQKKERAAKKKRKKEDQTTDKENLDPNIIRIKKSYIATKTPVLTDKGKKIKVTLGPR